MNLAHVAPRSLAILVLPAVLAPGTAPVASARLVRCLATRERFLFASAHAAILLIDDESNTRLVLDLNPASYNTWAILRSDRPLARYSRTIAKVACSAWSSTNAPSTTWNPYGGLPPVYSPLAFICCIAALVSLLVLINAGFPWTIEWHSPHKGMVAVPPIDLGTTW